MNTNHLFLANCFLQQTNHFDALELLGENTDNLNIGVKLQLYYEENKVYATKEEKKIGLLSDEDTKPIINYLKMKWGKKLFECRISKYDEKADENKRFSVAIFILENKEEEIQEETE